MSGTVDLWLAEYDTCQAHGQEAMEQILARNRTSKGSSQYAKLTAHARTAIQQYSAEMGKLREELVRATAQHRLVSRESDRRQAMMDQLVTKEKQLDAAFRKSDQSNYGQTRDALVGDAHAFAADPWSAPPDGATADMTVDQIRQQQQQAIDVQDTGLDALSHILSRQKQMAVDIGNEVDYQDELLDDIIDHTDRTGQRLLKETKHIRIVDRKSRTCYMWIIVVVLFVAIIVIGFVPFHGKI